MMQLFLGLVGFGLSYALRAKKRQDAAYPSEEDEKKLIALIDEANKSPEAWISHGFTITPNPTSIQPGGFIKISDASANENNGTFRVTAVDLGNTVAATCGSFWLPNGSAAL